jgi:hypothetical protein
MTGHHQGQLQSIELKAQRLIGSPDRRLAAMLVISVQSAKERDRRQASTLEFAG